MKGSGSIQRTLSKQRVIDVYKVTVRKSYECALLGSYLAGTEAHPGLLKLEQSFVPAAYLFRHLRLVPVYLRWLT